MSTFQLPDLGEGLTEAEIVAWHVSVGDSVTADQPLLSVETDKAVVEIPSPHAGTVAKLYAAPGDIVETGAPLVDLETAAAPDAGAIVGELEAAPPAATGTPAEPAVRANAAPAVRALAQQRGVDLTEIIGSGPDGAILSADVEKAAAAMAAGEPLRGVRRAMARAMTASGAAVVPATITDTADISAWGPDVDPTLRLIRAIVAACAAVPALNATFSAMRRTLHSQVDLTIATDTPDGLFAPVLRRVGSLSPDALATKLAALEASVRARTIAPEDLRGGTITLSNFGMLGGEYAALVVSPPQVAILGAGRIHAAVLAVEGAPQVRRVLPLSLSIDHRAVTGGEAARFMIAVRADLEQAD